MDVELQAYLDAMRKDFSDAQEQILSRLTALERDFQNTKGFLLGDGLASGRRWLELDERVARLERNQKSAS